jgi:hypothetical protein
MGDWHPDAVRYPGPALKTGENCVFVRNGRGAVLHSMEGPVSAALDRLDSYEDDSWQFSVPKESLADGPFYQHYVIETVCWHAGSAPPNIAYFGVEFEGEAGEPLTDHQMECGVSILAWAMDHDVEHWPALTLHDTLFEHNWLFPTACPSGRIPWEEVINLTTMFQQMQARLTAVETWRLGVQKVLNDHGDRVTGLELYRQMLQKMLNWIVRRLTLIETALKIQAPPPE